MTPPTATGFLLGDGTLLFNAGVIHGSLRGHDLVLEIEGALYQRHCMQTERCVNGALCVTLDERIRETAWAEVRLVKVLP